MSDTMMIEVPTGINKKNIPTIRPYVDKSSFNMGLEKYSIVVHDGVFHEEQLACLESNGIRRYITGLNEFAPEIKLLPEEQRIPKIAQIRNIVQQLEKELATNILDTEDTDFWNKVKLLRPDNEVFWNKIFIRCSNDPVFLDPLSNPHDLIKICAIEAGGFSIVAPSYEIARSMQPSPKFYLDKQTDTISTKTELKKLKNKAKAELQKLYDKNMNKLFYVIKVLDLNSVQYKKSTPNDILYDNADTYIEGEGTESNERRAITSFLDVCKIDIETLKIQAIVKDATFLRILETKSDGFIYHRKSQSMLGRNKADILEYLKNPLNDQILTDILNHVEKQWNQ